MKNNSRYAWSAVFFILTFLVDRVSKQWALLSCLDQQESDSFFSCYLIFNRGISWSMFHDDSSIQFVFITSIIVIITAFLCWYTKKMMSISFWGGIGGSIAVAGSVSNIIDRFLYGGVIDFILVQYQVYSFPVFNVADICIVVGIVLLCLEGYKKL